MMLGRIGLSVTTSPTTIKVNACAAVMKERAMSTLSKRLAFEASLNAVKFLLNRPDLHHFQIRRITARIEDLERDLFHPVYDPLTDHSSDVPRIAAANSP